MEKMRERFDAFLMKEIRIGRNVKMKVVMLLFGIFISVMGLLIRLALRHIVSGDMDGSLQEWISCIEQNGGFRALRLNFANYNPPYLYILTYTSVRPLSKYL